MSKNLYLRNGIFWARFKVGGVEYRESLRTRSEKVAERRLKIRREEVEDKALFKIAGPTSWQSAVVSWNENVSFGSERTFNRYVSSLIQLRAWLDDKNVHEITPEMVRDIIKARRRGGVKNATIRRDMTALSSVLNHCADEGWIGENPIESINLRRVAAEKFVPIVLPTEASIAIMSRRITSRMWDMFEFTRETGLRLEETTTLRHTSIDRAGRTITIKGKGSKVRTLPLTAKAVTIIDRQPRYIGKPLVFWRGEGEPIKDVSTRTTRYMVTAARWAAQRNMEFEPFSHHGMRHLFAVEYLRDRRGSIYDLQGEMGHGSISTTERYLAFLTPEQAKAAKSSVAQKPAREQRFASDDA